MSPMESLTSVLWATSLEVRALSQLSFSNSTQIQGMRANLSLAWPSASPIYRMMWDLRSDTARMVAFFAFEQSHSSHIIDPLCSVKSMLSLSAAIFFMIGTFTALIPSVQASAGSLTCGTDTNSWWTVFTYLVFLSCLALCLLTPCISNADNSDTAYQTIVEIYEYTAPSWWLKALYGTCAHACLNTMSKATLWRSKSWTPLCLPLLVKLLNTTSYMSYWLVILINT